MRRNAFSLRIRRLTKGRVGRGVTVSIAVALWLAATEPWGIAVYQLVVFMAPGALLGLASGWMAYAADQERWSWRVAGQWTIGGALLLPPVLAFLVAVDGNARPHRLLAGFIRAAWLSLALGLSVATARAITLRSQQARHQARQDLEKA